MQNSRAWQRLKADRKKTKSSRPGSSATRSSKSPARSSGQSRWLSRLWAGFFLVWALLVSGVLENTFHAPGIFQAIELKKLESERREKMLTVETEIASMQSETENLQKNVALQEREIRKTLGYVAEDEILFDFSAVSRVKPGQPGSAPR